MPDLNAPIIERTALNRLGEASKIGAEIAALLFGRLPLGERPDIEASGGGRL